MTLSHRYSPYLGRYVLSLSPQVDYLAAVQRTVEVTPLVAKGSIEAYSFPDTADVGVDKPWSAKVHNVGDLGRLGLGIGNAAGNPGSIVLTWQGNVYTIDPGNYLRISTTGEVPNCTRIDTSGEIAFQTKGSYTLRILGIHLDGATWYYDDERQITVTVTGVAPPEWPFQYPVPFSGRLAPGAVLEATDSTPVKDVDLTKLLGGRVDYALRYESGILTGMNVYIYWNDELIATERLSNVGQTATGTFDLGKARIRATNTLSIKMVQGPLGYNVCGFDCPAVLGFSEEPDQPPGGEEWYDKLLEWVDKNKYWIALGVAGTGFLLLYRPGPGYPAMPIIMYPPTQPPRREESRER